MLPALLRGSFGILLYAVSANALANGVGRLPALGYNTWNAFGCNVNEDLVLEAAQLMVSLGLQDVGYEYVNVDDCYAEPTRNASGFLVANSVRFASGLKNLTDQIHALGFKAGIYSDSGWETCGGFPGSFQNEARDAATFQEWGFEYLKFDNCNIPFDDIIRQGMLGKYTRMADALIDLANSTGQPPFLFSLCQWVGNKYGSGDQLSAKLEGDIETNWASLASIINFNSFITQATDFFGHNDMDMLQLGNGGFTFDESKTHFTAWALMKSPILIGTNEPQKTPKSSAINQDPVVGQSVSPFRWGLNPDFTSNSSFPAQFYSGPTQNGTVFMLINTLDQPEDMFFNLTESPTYGPTPTMVPLYRNFTAAAVPSHGVVALLLQDAGDEPAGIFPPCAVWDNCAFENGTAAN
ncbi:glycoside hydrolase [Gymnopus androsaceus JB14]|uniref:Alpha-galactosidase n=1 Tax=Gymnopus androsaceus JB14 TaxID=1447944 RepID=A0A6A4GEM0_9AGAR|nr:glycoside hydrolase [Gymnopus androsaceus JB14]